MLFVCKARGKSSILLSCILLFPPPTSRMPNADMPKQHREWSQNGWSWISQNKHFGCHSFWRPHQDRNLNLIKWDKLRNRLHNYMQIKFPLLSHKNITIGSSFLRGSRAPRLWEDQMVYPWLNNTRMFPKSDMRFYQWQLKKEKTNK